MQQKVSAFSTSWFLPNTELVTFITGNVNIQSMKAKHVLLTPLLLAPEENVELNIRNYWNWGDCQSPTRPVGSTFLLESQPVRPA